jgi:hypothetical protein
MPELKLAKLPDRTPGKITITVTAELNQALRQYAEIYRSTYGEDEEVAALIPFMLEAFLESDREFAKARKNIISGSPAALSEKSLRQRPTAVSTSIGKEV